MKVKRFIAVIGLSIMMVCTMMPSIAFASEHPTPNGHINIDYHINKMPKQLEAQESFPDYYNSAKQSWYKGIRVKDQQHTEHCWAFSTTTAAEISYAKETRSVQETSPRHLAYFFYNRVNDPLGNTAGDKNLCYGKLQNAGGDCGITQQHLATYSGLATENSVPFTDPIRPVDKAKAYDDYIVMQNSEYHYGRYDRTEISTLKRMITEHGAVVASLAYYNDYVGTDGYSFYDDEGYYNNNHEIAIIGWDDNYDRTKFDAGWYYPDHDGAWICQNSWGKNEQDHGYFYISYESYGPRDDSICGYDLMPADTYKYNYQYDGNANNDYWRLDANESAANVFTAQRQIKLEAIGFTNWNDGTARYRLEVYSGLANSDDAWSGTKQCSKVITTESPGFKTFPITPVTIDGGESYSIVIKPLDEISYIGIEDEVPNGFIYGNKAQIDMGQSYYDDTDGYYDMCLIDDSCFRIKGLANDTFCTHSWQVKETVKATENTDGYTVYQCSKCGAAKADDYVLRGNVVPYDTVIKSLKKGKKSFTAYWYEQMDQIAGKHYAGYQIRYSLKSNMKGAKVVTVNGYETNSKVIKKLKAKKKYYVQVRTIYKADSGKKYYSAWSGKKSVKTK